MKQHYEKYTKEDLLVWRTLFERQMVNLSEKVSACYLEALEQVQFRPDKIPDFQEVNGILKTITGWSLEVVPGIIPQKEFFGLLRAQRFPASTWLRKMSQLDYLEEPDMFHDVFGHVPLLSNQAYTRFFKGIAELALKHAENAWAIELLGRIYWFTVEFGLIREQGKLKIYGAGIISSSGETDYSLSNQPRHLEFNVREILRSDFRNDVFQEKYFVIESFEQLFCSLSEIESILEEEIMWEKTS
jgi:phenylalanine-4-hydroxylase